MNRDGFVNKKEFQWMTTNTILSQKKIDTKFKVLDINKQIVSTHNLLNVVVFRDATSMAMENSIMTSS